MTVLRRIMCVADEPRLSRVVMLAGQLCVATWCISLWFVRGVPGRAFLGAHDRPEALAATEIIAHASVTLPRARAGGQRGVRPSRRPRGRRQAGPGAGVRETSRGRAAGAWPAPDPTPPQRLSLPLAVSWRSPDFS